MNTLTFDHDWVGPILAGEKTATVRLAEELDGERLMGLTIGLAIDDAGEHPNVFADVVVTSVTETLAGVAYQHLRDRPNYPCPGTLTEWLDNMRDYYGAGFDRETRVAIITWELKRGYPNHVD